MANVNRVAANACDAVATACRASVRRRSAGVSTSPHGLKAPRWHPFLDPEDTYSIRKSKNRGTARQTAMSLRSPMAASHHRHTSRTRGDGPAPKQGPLLGRGRRQGNVQTEAPLLAHVHNPASPTSSGRSRQAGVQQCNEWDLYFELFRLAETCAGSWIFESRRATWIVRKNCSGVKELRRGNPLEDT